MKLSELIDEAERRGLSPDEAEVAVTDFHGQPADAAIVDPDDFDADDPLKPADEIIVLEEEAR